MITSHDPLPSEAQQGVTAEFKDLFPNTALRFDTDTEQAPGLVLRMGGAQVAWTVESYIDGLDAMILDRLAKEPNLKAQTDEQ